MSSLQDEYYTQVDNIFNNIRPNRFGQPVTDPTPYENSDQVVPAAWVQNASAADGTANVTIDANGITILNGAITLSDVFGTNVLTGGGFGSSWLDFLNTLFYNGTFLVGDTSEITVSEVAGGATVADYAASLSQHLPYFICATNTGAGTFSRVADSTSISGFSIRFTGTKTAEFYQDIPIIAGQGYDILATVAASISGGATADLLVKTQYRDQTHGAIGVEVTGATRTINATTAYGVTWLHTKPAAPANARFLRVKVRYNRTAGSPSVWISNVFTQPHINYGQQVIATSNSPFQIMQQGDTTFRFQIAGDGALSWDDGTAGSSVSLSYDWINGDHMYWGTGDLIDQDAAGIGRARSTVISVSNSTWTKLTLSTSMWAGLASTNNPYSGNEVRVDAPGVYIIVGRAGFTGNAGGTRRILACSFGSGATPSATPATADEHEYVTGGNAFDIHSECTYIKKLAANDTVALTCHQNSGGALDVFDISLYVARIGV